MYQTNKHNECKKDKMDLEKEHAEIGRQLTALMALTHITNCTEHHGARPHMLTSRLRNYRCSVDDTD